MEGRNKPTDKGPYIKLEDRESFRQLGDFIVSLDIGFAKAVKLAFFLAHNFDIKVRKHAKK